MRSRLLVVFAVMALWLALASTALAHPATPPQSIGVANPAAMDGLHTACGNVDGIAFHVLLERVSPHGGQ
jgi:hypothetical protein